MPPQRALPAPWALLALEAVGSVWKAVLRELEGGWWPGCASSVPLRTAWARLAPWFLVDLEQGVWGSSQHSSHPGLEGWRGMGVQREPGTFWHLEKADPQRYPALVVLPPEGS